MLYIICIVLVLQTKANAPTRFSGIIVGKEDIDPVRWPQSEWRSLKVNFKPVPTCVFTVSIHPVQ